MSNFSHDTSSSSESTVSVRGFMIDQSEVIFDDYFFSELIAPAESAEKKADKVRNSSDLNEEIRWRVRAANLYFAVAKERRALQGIVESESGEANDDETKASEQLSKAVDLVTSPSFSNNSKAISALQVADVMISNSVEFAGSGKVAPEQILSIAIAESSKDQRLLSYIRGLEARIAEKARDITQAISLTEDAVMLAESSNSLEYLFVWYGQLAQLHQKLGNLEAASEYFRRSLNEIERVRQDLAQSSTSSYDINTPRSLTETILLAYADLQLNLSAYDQEAAILNARSGIELLKRVEFDQFFEEACVTRTTSESMPLEQASPSTVVLYPILFADRLELILTRKETDTQSLTIKRATTFLNRSEFEYIARSTLNSLRLQDNDIEGLNSNLNRLYDWIIHEELESDILSAETLVFVPAGVLRDIPVGALYDGNKYLIEKVAVSTSLDLLINREDTRRDQQPFGILVGVSENLSVGSSQPSSTRSTLGSLPNVVAELEVVAKNLRGSQLLNKDFTPSKFREQMDRQRYSVVHIATHAQFGSRAEDSYLLAHSGEGDLGEKINLNTLEAYTSSARIRGEAIDLLVLSACETAVADFRAEDESVMLGLAGAAYKAGAKSVLGSLWKVDDESTAKLMGYFYENLNRDSQMSKATALQKAQIELLNSKNSSEKLHPSLWSAFVLFGDWR